MGKPEIITSREAAALLADGAVVGSCGFLMHGAAEEIWMAIEQRYLEEQKPRDLTLMWASGIGDGKMRGLNHLCHEGLIAKTIGGHYGLIKKMHPLINENKIAAYNYPQGVLSQMFRDMAAKKPAMVTKIGLGTFVDPEFGGGCVNAAAKEPITRRIEIDGEDYLMYTCQKLDYAILRGTEADENGNISFRKEALSWESLSVAMAARNNGGKIIVQVEKIVKNGAIDPKDVKIPGIMVDYIVITQDMDNHWQTMGTKFNEEFISRRTRFEAAVTPVPAVENFTIRDIIGRRGALAVRKSDYILNYGIGMPESVASVLDYENVTSHFMATVEPGVIGGVAQGGGDFGSAIGAEAIIDEPYQFDFYDGGGLDLTFLGMAECDATGSINVSRFGPDCPGCGGFIDISQSAKMVVFCGSFTAKGLKVKVEDKKLIIVNEGTTKKFINKLEQITFNGVYEAFKGKTVLYITERAVFQLKEEGLTLIEIAPGVDMEKDILAQMEFAPVISTELKLMDERIFSSDSLGLSELFAD